MKLLVLYRLQSENARPVEEFLREFERRTGRKAEVIDPDRQEGSELTKLYDIVNYPAILATTDDGQMLQYWQGEQLPLIDEVAGYLQS